MLGGADNPNGELLSYIIGADTAGWSGICGKILTVSGYSVATSWNGSRCSITAGL